MRLVRATLGTFGIFCLVLVSGCRCTSPKSEPFDAGVPSATIPTDAAISHTERDAGPISSEELANERTYVETLTRGRALTRQKKYADAIAAFDAAARLEPHDARVLAERGYAKLLAGDFADAVGDLDDARARTADPKLLGPIWFNLGLVEERWVDGQRSSGGRDDFEPALVDFFMSNRYLPTAAARAKIQTKDICPIKLDDTHQELLTASTWLDVFNALSPTAKQQAGTLASDAAAKEHLCETGCTGAGPWIVSVGWLPEKNRWDGITFGLVMPAGKGYRVLPLDTEVGGRCTGDLDYDVVHADATMVHVRSRGSTGGVMDFMCNAADGFRPCREDDPEDIPRSTACPVVGSVKELFVDPQTHSRVLEVEHALLADSSEAASDPLAVDVALAGPNQIRVTNAVCKKTIAIRQ